MFAFLSRIFILSAAAAHTAGAFSIHGCWTDTRIHIPRFSLLTSVYCRTAVVLGRFLYCVCVCCFAPLVGPPHHQHHQRVSLFIPFSVALSPALQQTPLFNLYMHTVSSQIATVFIISSTVCKEISAILLAYLKQ